MKTIFHNQPSVGVDEYERLRQVLKSRQLAAGKTVFEFEKKITSLIDRKYATAVNTGHAALHLSLIALGIKKDDEIIMPAYTVSDILNPIFYVGAKPILVDTEKGGFNISPELVKEKINKNTKAIIVPHMLGFPAKIDVINKFGIPVIEDAAQALGTKYKNNYLGSFGIISILSFYTTKLITTGQGGMLLTNNLSYYECVKDLLDYNAPRNYRVRYNYTMTELAAGIGLVQFQKIKKFINIRRLIANQYQKILEEKGIDHYPKKQDKNVNHFRFILQLKNKKECDYALKMFKENGIIAIRPLKQFELPHRLLHYDVLNFPHTETISQTVLSLPIYPDLRQADINRIVKTIKSL